MMEMELILEFMGKQQEINEKLRYRVRILEQKNTMRESREIMGETDTGKKNTNDLMARIMHLEGRVLEMERELAIKNLRTKKMIDGYNKVDIENNITTIPNGIINHFKQDKIEQKNVKKDFIDYLGK